MTIKTGDKIRILQDGYYNSDVKGGDILIVRGFSDSISTTFIADTEDETDWWFYNSGDLNVGFELVKEEISSVNTVVQSPVDTPARIDGHYDFFYDLNPNEVKFQQLKVDPYFVSKQWRVGARDPSGALFHILKTVARFGDKNPPEREIKAIYLQIKRLAELEGVELE